jgi:hypothetical protein
LKHDQQTPGKEPTMSYIHFIERERYVREDKRR